MTAPGQADEYDLTPTEAEVRHCVQHERHGYMTTESFDRFLAARDRAVREAALEEGVRAAAERWSPFLSPPPQEWEIAEIVRAAANQTGEANGHQ